MVKLQHSVAYRNKQSDLVSWSTDFQGSICFRFYGHKGKWTKKKPLITTFWHFYKRNELYILNSWSVIKKRKFLSNLAFNKSWQHCQTRYDFNAWCNIPSISFFLSVLCLWKKQNIYVKKITKSKSSPNFSPVDYWNSWRILFFPTLK